MQHARRLREGLDAVLTELDEYEDAQREVRIVKAKRGTPITVEGRADIPLEVGSGRGNTGFALLNVLRAASAVASTKNDAVDTATFFATRKSLGTIADALDKYAEWEAADVVDGDVKVGPTETERRPSRFVLFESASAFRPTTLRDFWTDTAARFPRRRDRNYLWEVWVRLGALEDFERSLRHLDLPSQGQPSFFVDTAVSSVDATPLEIMSLIRSSGAVVQLRSACSFASGDVGRLLADRAAHYGSMAGRLVAPSSNAPTVTVLDTGVHRDHSLLTTSLRSRRRYAADPSWGVGDHDGHGTMMAGIVQFGDLDDIPTDDSPIELVTHLESVVVTPPENTAPLPARDALREAVVQVEARESRRIYCLAQTAEGESEDGRPTGTSSVLDQLAFNDGTNTRLFCVAVGNTPHSDLSPYQVADYVSRNGRFGIQSPAQALNALSVGAAALKEVDLPHLRMLAEPGDLSPSSRTSESWPTRGVGSDVVPAKPDIVMEGGNFSIDDDGQYCSPSHHHEVVTTGRMARRPFVTAGQTSAATAAAAGLSARLLAAYPDLRMESLRGLMVHHADWTPRMLAHHADAIATGRSSIQAYRQMIGRFGWGRPNEERLFSSAAHALTLVAEDEIVPYVEPSKGSRLRLKEMKYFRLPWPTRTLRALGRTQVELRCTLSYFVEPDPRAIARDRIDGYPSHRLRFDVRRYGESHGRTEGRSNILAPGADDGPAGSDTGWLLGFRDRQRGSLHHDIWRGPAHELVGRDGIAVSPVRGWWGDAASLGMADRAVRFSLIVSIRTPIDASGDLVAEALNKVPAKMLVSNVLPIEAE